MNALGAAWAFSTRRLDRWVRLQYLGVLRETASPGRAGLGFGLGAFIGIFPTFGVGSLLAFYVARRLRWGRRAAVIGTLVMNPLTAPFFYSLSACLGAWLLNRNVAIVGVRNLFASVQDLGLSLFLGSAIVAAVSAVLLGSAVYLWLKSGHPVQVDAPVTVARAPLDRNRGHSGLAPFVSGSWDAAVVSTDFLAPS